MKIELNKEIKLPSAALGVCEIPGEDHLLVSCFDGSILKLNTKDETWEELGKHGSYASGIVTCLDGTMAVSAGYDGVIQWHDLKNGK
ncbi:MAG: hypothetical protein HOH33_16840, partial [Verrucomicrobia bacterium]|nr:hypothetical protein [Verrucomicrobiota bacterium]